MTSPLSPKPSNSKGAYRNNGPQMTKVAVASLGGERSSGEGSDLVIKCLVFEQSNTLLDK